MKGVRVVISAMMTVIIMSSTVLAAGTQSTFNLYGLKVLELPTTIAALGGKLLLSDSPEVVPEDGIMYQDVVNGDVRLFFHHVNGSKLPKKMVVLLENQTEQYTHITVYRYGLGGPGYNFLQVGKDVQLDYMKGDDAYLLEVAGKEAVSLIPSLDQSIVKPDMLVNGMYDFKTEGPVNVKVMMMPIDADVREFAARAKVLPPDVGPYRLRGTFEGKNRLVIPNKTYNPYCDGVVSITLADNVLDRYAIGIDATDGSATTNYGNYGIVYQVFTPSVAKGKLSYYLNPQGGEYAGWLGVEYRHQDEYAIATPTDKMSFGTKTLMDSAYIGTYDGGRSTWLTFSPPGASNLPIRLIIAPSK